MPNIFSRWFERRVNEAVAKRIQLILTDRDQLLRTRWSARGPRPGDLRPRGGAAPMPGSLAGQPAGTPCGGTHNPVRTRWRHRPQFKPSGHPVFPADLVEPPSKPDAAPAGGVERRADPLG